MNNIDINKLRYLFYTIQKAINLASFVSNKTEKQYIYAQIKQDTLQIQHNFLDIIWAKKTTK